MEVKNVIGDNTPEVFDPVERVLKFSFVEVQA